MRGWTLHRGDGDRPLIATLLAAAALAGPVAASSPRAPVRRAVVVGVGNYRHPEYRENAVSTVADAQAVRALLAARGGFEVVEFSGALDEATLDEALRSAPRGLGPRDQLVVFYAGHAEAIPLPGRPGEWDLALLPADARPGAATTSGVPLSRLFQELAAAAPGDVLVVVDACRSTRDYHHPSDARWPMLQAEGGGRAWVTLYATDPFERAVDGDDHGLLTAAILDGATRAGAWTVADADQSGGTSAVELALHAASDVAARRPSQRPQVLLDVRGRERFTILDEDTSDGKSIVYGKPGWWMRVNRFRGALAAVEPGLATVEGGHDAGPGAFAAVVRLRAGEEFALAALADEPPAKLHAGAGVLATPTDLGSTLSATLVVEWTPRDLLLGRPTLGVRTAWGLDPIEERAYPNGAAFVTAGHALGAVSAGARGLDALLLGPTLGAGVLVRWPEAVEGGVAWQDAHPQVGFAGLALLEARLEVGGLGVTASAGARFPVVDGAPEAEAVVGLAGTGRVVSWGRR